MADELNVGMDVRELTREQLESFHPSPVPVLVRFEKGDCVYKWSEYGTLAKPGGGISEYWFPWKGLKIGQRDIEGFKEFRVRHRNVGGSVGRPQQAARALGAVTEQWNDMSAILKAQFEAPVWGFVGRTSGQRKFVDPLHQREQANVFFIGGAYQVVVPNLTARWIRKL